MIKKVKIFYGEELIKIAEVECDYDDEDEAMDRASEEISYSAVPEIRLNERGQCPFCKVKPLVYKRDSHKFCCRCDRAYDLESGIMIGNWKWNSDNTPKEKNG